MPNENQIRNENGQAECKKRILPVGASKITDWSDYETEKLQTAELESEAETETASAAK